MNDISQILSVTTDILAITALLTGTVLAIIVSVQYAPFVKLRILPKWLDDDSGRVILRLEIENISKVKINNQYIALQVLEYPLPKNSSIVISEWVPFVEGKYQKLGSEEPPEEPKQKWQKPVPIFTSTKTIYPSEILSVERSYGCPKDSFLKVGLQLKATSSNSKFVQWVTRKLNWADQWTTTAIIFRE